MKGNASGNTEMSSRFLASSCSRVVDLVPEVRANTMSSEIKNSSVPPAMRNELKEIPMMSRNRAPTKREQHADDERDGRGLARHFSLVAGARAVGQTGEQRNQGNGLDHDEKHHEEFDELFDHVIVAARKIYILREWLIGS